MTDNCGRCKNTGTLTFMRNGEEMARLCPDCKGESWMIGRLDKIDGDKIDRPQKKQFWQEWAELDAGAKVLVLAAFGFGIWLIYMFASASMNI